MGRLLSLAYGVICYVAFFGTFLYTIGFLANFGVPKSVDSGTPAPLGETLLVNLALLGLFAVQHSGMARQGFKRVLTRFVPPPVERSTYVLASSVVLWALFAWWRPMPEALWSFESTAARTVGWALYAGGLGLVLYSTFLIDHFDLFGLRQVILHWKQSAYSERHFHTPSLYRFVRHPLYVGWFVTFWATPDMTVGHFLLAAGVTGYILGAIPLEERDLSQLHGEPYRRWRALTPKFLPRFGRGGTTGAVPEAGRIAHSG